jgi:hypothetical protein
VSSQENSEFQVTPPLNTGLTVLEKLRLRLRTTKEWEKLLQSKTLPTNYYRILILKLKFMSWLPKKFTITTVKVRPFAFWLSFQTYMIRVQKREMSIWNRWRRSPPRTESTPSPSSGYKQETNLI